MQDGRGEHAQQNAKEQAEHRYYRHGALKRTELGRDLQGMDYVYTIQGWLKAINSPDEQWRDPGDDGVENSVNQAFSPDLFGMSLDYFSEDYTRANTGISTHLGYTGEPAPQYSGLVRAQRWNNRALGEEPLTAPGTPLMYAYAYDVHGQLVKAQLGQVYSTQQGGSPTVYLGEDHKVFDIAYDKNGNLTQLKRNGTAAIAQGMDLLTYHYPVDPNSQRTNNRLDRVTDTGSDHHDYLGFGLLSGQNAGNYSYNALGQLTGDVREGKTYTYYANGRIKDVAITAAVGYQPVSFAYDAAGNRVQKVTYDTDGTTPLQRTWYLRDATGAVRSYLLEDVVEETFTAELPIPGVGTYLRASEQVRYEISDHLGNTRVSFTRDEEGEPLVLEAHDYYPHGGLMPGRQLNGSAGSPLAYQGQEFDKEVGLSAFNLRQYDARLGRWLTPDPYAQHYSPYLGMSNNPVSFTDPDGGYDRIYVDGMPVFGFNVQQLLQQYELSGAVFDLQMLDLDENGRVSYEMDFRNVKMVAGQIKSTTEKRYAEFMGIRSAQTYSTSNSISTCTSVALFKDPYTGSLFVDRSGPGVIEVSRSLGSFADRIRVMHDLAQAERDMHDGLDLGGLFPGAEVFDGLNALAYAAEGDFGNAALSATAMIPIAGWLATGGKVLNRGSDALKGAKDVNYVYRGLAEGEDIGIGLLAKMPGAGNSPISHVAGQKATQWISSSKSEAIALNKYGKFGVVRIDLNKVTNPIMDLSGGIPGKPGMLSNWAIKDQEILIQNFVPPEAIMRIR